MASIRMINVSRLAGCIATIAGTCLIFATSVSLADAFWTKNDSSWCLKYETSSTCLPLGSEASKISAGEVIFEVRGDEIQLPVVISSTSDERAQGTDSVVNDRETEVLYSSREDEIETTVLKGPDIYFVEFRLAPNANLSVAGFELDQIEKIASDMIHDWSVKSRGKKDAERCERFFHAGCVEH